MISNVEESTEPVSSMEKLKTCNPKDLNEGINRKHYAIPMKGDVIAEKNDTKVFTKLDASYGF